MKGLLGWGFYLAAPAFAVSSIMLFTCGDRPIGARVFATVMMPVLLSALSELMLSTGIRDGVAIRDAVNDLFELGKVMKSGGVIGGLIAWGMNRTLSMYGTLPLLVLGFLYCFVVCCWGSMRGLVARITRSHNAYVRYEQEHQKIEKKAAARGVADLRTAPKKQPTKIMQGTRQGMFNVDIPLGEEDDSLDLNAVAEKVKKAPVRKTTRATANTKIIRDIPLEDEDYLSPAAPGSESVLSEVEAAMRQPLRPAAQEKKPEKKEPRTVKPQPKTRSAKAEPAKVETLKRDAIAEERQKIEQEIAGSDTAPDEYVYPPLSLLRASSGGIADATDEVNLNRVRLEEAIQSFGISAAVVGVIRGPTVTRYDLELDRGVKLARITNLAGDLALSLGVVNVRIAPIPDKISTVGIEVPNKTVSTVFLRDILDSANFSGAKSKLSFALGKDIGGNCIVGNISKLPHLLIAGTTGSGKSVCMNSLILSLLYKARPDEVKLIMIDPKMVELGIYNGIPHLYVPVVTDPKKAAGALQWSVVEMLKRYRAFSEIGVRDLDAYNRIMLQQQQETLPRVVIVIDELADLMLVASKDVEESICRVAQMGRAAGMHLVIATQRPSADVITGLMKANIPSRIAFAVSSALESRIILDQGGAEKLIGFGDMLYSPIGSGKPTRIQGSFVSDEEREDVINFIKEHNNLEVEKNSEIEEYMVKATKDKNSASEEKSGGGESPAGDYDEMLPQAAEVVIEMGSCSVSMLQRRIKLGYSRAARIVDQMEELGIVGPYEGAKPRSVTIDKAGWQELQVKLGFLPADALPQSDAGLVDLAEETEDDADADF
ncbi:MAG: DNA translocase FtsK [Oscillospiraceae bacterium]|nr:DNA translocase FtsK [Oscillospiraceae bacterium]